MTAKREKEMGSAGNGDKRGLRWDATRLTGGFYGMNTAPRKGSLNWGIMTRFCMRDKLEDGRILG